LGAPSPDGRYLSFVDVETGDLAVRDLATGERRRLTNNRAAGEFAYFSAISPDSRQVAYAWFNEQKFYDLRVVGVDGGQSRTLYRNPEAGFVQPCAWTPDGKQILTLLFRKDTISQITLIAAADGAVRVLKSLNWVYPKKMDFSPDGRFIVYDAPSRDGSPQRDIFALTVDGARETRLVEHPADDLFPLWMPDGSGVVFASERAGTMDAWKVPVADGKALGEPQLIQRDLGRFLPMGITRQGALYFGRRAGSTDVYITTLDLESGKLLEPPALATRRFAGANSSPEWSPDGGELAYFSRRGSENYGQEARVIVVRSVRTGQERELAPRLSHMERFRWSPDGRSLLVSGSDRRARGGLFRVDARSGEFEPVVQEDTASFRGFDGVWSGDGKAIFYLHGGVRWRELSGRQEKQIYRGAPGAPLSHLALSPDGSRLALLESGALLVMPAAGGPARERAKVGEEVSGLEWSPDGKHLLVSGAKDVWQISVESGSPRKLELPADRQGPARLHPDGRRIAFAVGKTQSEVWVMNLPVRRE
jgi:Tol biopolymer transport system component